MKENVEEKKKVGLFRMIFGGVFFDKIGIIKNIGFIIYLFALIILLVSVQLGVRKTQTIQEKNHAELTSLKAEYINIESIYLEKTQWFEVEKSLNRMKSKVKPPENPPKSVQSKTN